MVLNLVPLSIVMLTSKVYLDRSTKAKEEYQVKLAEYKASMTLSVSI